MDSQNKNRIIKISKTIISGTGAAALNFLITLIIIPFVTASLGKEAYGFVSLANNFVSYITIVTLALNSYATRYISIEYHKKKYVKAQSYFTTVIITNILIGILVIVLGYFFAKYINCFLNVPQYIQNDTKTLFLFVFINFTLQTIGNTFSVFAYIHDHLDLVGFFKFIAYITEGVIFILFFKIIIPKLWYVGIAYLSFSIVTFIGNFYLYKRYANGIKIQITQYSIHAVKILVINGIWNSLNSLGNTLNSGLDLLITNRMLNTSIMGELAIAKTIGSIIPTMYQLISQAFQPNLLKYYAEKEKTKLIHELIFSMKVSGYFVGIFFCLFVALGDYFYKLWIPNQNIHFIYILTILTLISYVLEGVVGPLYYIYTLTVKNKLPCIITILGGTINVLAMYFLLKHTSMGAYAVVITTAVIMTFINFITNPIYISKCLQLNWKTFYPYIIKYVIIIIVACIIMRKVSLLLAPCEWKSIFWIAIPEGFIFSAIYILVMTKNFIINPKNKTFS